MNYSDLHKIFRDFKLHEKQEKRIRILKYFSIHIMQHERKILILTSYRESTCYIPYFCKQVRGVREKISKISLRTKFA